MATVEDIRRRMETIQDEPRKFSYALLGFAVTSFLALAGVLLAMSEHRPADSCGLIAILFVLGSLGVGGVGLWYRRDHDPFQLSTDLLPHVVKHEADQNPTIDRAKAEEFLKATQPELDECNLRAAYDLQDILHVQGWLLAIAGAFVVAWVVLRVFNA